MNLGIVPIGIRYFLPLRCTGRNSLVLKCINFNYRSRINIYHQFCTT
jgi:hypothetical protein